MEKQKKDAQGFDSVNEEIPELKLQDAELYEDRHSLAARKRRKRLRMKGRPRLG